MTLDAGVQTVPLSHYGDASTLTPYAATQASTPHTFDKPRGLWVSVDGPDDWAQWCEAEEFRDTAAQHRHRITLTPDANILHLTSVEQMIVFHTTYSVPDPIFATAPDAVSNTMRAIDWARVAAGYQGIIIAPYQWAVRTGLGTGLQWYYGWDCASGCIWDPTAIESVTKENPQ